MDLSIIIPALNECDNLVQLLPALYEAMLKLGISYEILIVDGGSIDDTKGLPLKFKIPIKVLQQNLKGYGEALKTGFLNAKGKYFLTLDADMSHDPVFIEAMWAGRKKSEVVIASRYVPGGRAEMPKSRLLLSQILNTFFSRGLSLHLKDLSSGYRLYNASVIHGLELQSQNFEILEEIIIKCIANGWTVQEIPMVYRPRKCGRSKAKLIKFGFFLLKTFFQMWRLRNSVESADYDDRAFDSRIPLQRYWQRKRFEIITNATPKAGRILDVGCGSSRILSAFPRVIGLDILLSKLRYDRKYHCPLINGSIWNLPFKDNQFDCVICSEVIERIPAGDKPFLEIRRVLKEGGKLILGTPDYKKKSWRMMEFFYGRIVSGGDPEKNITHYNGRDLQAFLRRIGFKIYKIEYIFEAEMILICTLDGERR